MYLHDDKLRTVTLNLTVKLISHVYQNAVSSCLSFLTLTLSNFTIFYGKDEGPIRVLPVCAFKVHLHWTKAKENFSLIFVTAQCEYQIGFFMDEEKSVNCITSAPIQTSQYNWLQSTNQIISLSLASCGCRVLFHPINKTIRDSMFTCIWLSILYLSYF